MPAPPLSVSAPMRDQCIVAPPPTSVIPRASVQRVVTGTALEVIRECIADQKIAEVRPNDALDCIADNVAGGIAVRNAIERGGLLRCSTDRCARAQSHANGCGRAGVTHCVDITVIEGERRAAKDGVGARAALDHIAERIAAQIIIELRADQILDIREQIAGGVAVVIAICDIAVMPNGRPGIRERNRNGRLRGRIFSRIIARGAIDHVGAKAAHEGVVQLVAQEAVVESRTDDALNQEQCIAFGIAAQPGACNRRVEHGSIKLIVTPAAEVE
jgi:hypothetical protein